MAAVEASGHEGSSVLVLTTDSEQVRRTMEGLTVSLARLIPRSLEVDEVELGEIGRASGGQGQRASWRGQMQRSNQVRLVSRAVAERGPSGNVPLPMDPSYPSVPMSLRGVNDSSAEKTLSEGPGEVDRERAIQAEAGSTGEAIA